MNSENLKPVRTTGEAQELGRRGGVKSGESRRRKASLRELIRLALESEYRNFLGKANGKTYGETLAAELVRQAASGDLRAISMLLKLEVDESTKTVLE